MAIIPSKAGKFEKNELVNTDSDTATRSCRAQPDTRSDNLPQRKTDLDWAESADPTAAKALLCYTLENSNSEVGFVVLGRFGGIAKYWDRVNWNFFYVFWIN